VSLRALTAFMLCLATAAAGAAQNSKSGGPESFRANGQIGAEPGGVASSMTIRIERYTADADHQALVAALNTHDQAAFLAALKKTPEVGTLTMGKRSIPIRWARQQAQGQDRRVGLMTGEPAYFFGAGAVDAKPTAGYDVAVIEFTIDSVGIGNGSMAMAAKVKPGGATGIEIEDYSGKRVTLVTVTKIKS
jgi:hypothetical protein